MSTFVFLHDAFQGGWVWENVAQAIRLRGETAATPSFTGCGERSHIAVTGNPYATYLDDVTNYFLYEEIGEAVLVCSGIAGMLAPTLVERLGERISRVIFVDAVLPQPGRSVLEVTPEPMARQIRQSASEDAVSPLPSPLVKMLCDAADLQKLSPFPLRAFTEPHPEQWPEQWPECHFLHCSGHADPLADTMLERARALDMDVHLLPLDEYPYWLRHEELARTLTSMLPPLEPEPERGPCGRTRMPEALRMAYCSHHRRRVARAAMCAQGAPVHA